MKYYVDTFEISIGLFGVKKDKMDEKLAGKLNELASQGYTIVSVVPLDTSSNCFDYQIVYCK